MQSNIALNVNMENVRRRSRSKEGAARQSQIIRDRDGVAIEYKNYEKMIQKICWSFFLHCQANEYIRVDFDDLISEANLAFVDALRRYNPEKVKFITFLHVHVNNMLKNFLRSQTVKKRLSIQVELSEDLAHHEGVEDRCIFRNMFEKTSSSIQEIVQLIVDTPQNLTSLTKSALRNYLLNEGWSSRKINQSFQKIEEILEVAR